MLPSGILETVLYAKDLDGTERFYDEALGLSPFAKAQGRHLFFRCGNQVLLIFNPEATKTPPALAPCRSRRMAWRGRDICVSGLRRRDRRLARRAGGKGIAIEADFEWPGGGRSIYFRDPAGNCLEFAEPRIWKLA